MNLENLNVNEEKDIPLSKKKKEVKVINLNDRYSDEDLADIYGYNHPKANIVKPWNFLNNLFIKNSLH